MKQKIFALFLILCGLCLNLKAETQGDVVGRVLDDSAHLWRVLPSRFCMQRVG